MNSHNYMDCGEQSNETSDSIKEEGGGNLLTSWATVSFSRM